MERVLDPEVKEGPSDRLKTLHTEIWDRLLEAQEIIEHAEDYLTMQREAAESAALAAKLRKDLDAVCCSYKPGRDLKNHRDRVLRSYQPLEWSIGDVICTGDSGPFYRYAGCTATSLFVRPLHSEEHLMDARRKGSWHLVEEKEESKDGE